MAVKSDSEQRETLRKIVTGCRTAFMVTRGDGHNLHGRPMATAHVDPGMSSLWFASDRHSAKVEEILRDDHVYIGCSNATGSEWASLNGRARIVDDLQKAKELWSPFWKNWFTGPDDPKLVLLQFTPESAEYWDSGSSLLVALKLAFTAVTGKTVDEGEHVKLDLQSTR